MDIRTKKVKNNIVYMLFLKSGSIVTNLLMVPLLISILGKEIYGVWITIFSLMTLLNFFDIGIGHGLRNNVASAIAKKDDNEAKITVSTSYIFLGIVTSFLGVFFILFHNYIDWAHLLNAPDSIIGELNDLMLYLIVFFIFNFFLKLINSLMFALQIPSFANLVVFINQLTSLLVLFLMVKFNVEMTIYTVGFVLSIIPVITLLILSFILFRGKLKDLAPSLKYFRAGYIKGIFSLGFSFFIIQITAIVIFQSNNMIIAHTIGPTAVTEFNIAYKYMGVLTMLFAIITTPFWSATTDAFTRGDFNWIRSVVKKLNLIWFAFVLLGIIMVLISDRVYTLWIGDEIRPNKIIIITLSLYVVFQMRWFIYGNILNGMSKVRLQLLFTTSEALLHIPLAIILGNRYGLFGVLLSMVFMTFINTIWPIFQYKKIIEGKAAGIWNK